MTDDLTRLAHDLRAVAVTCPVAVRGVVQKGALNIKNDWRQRWSGHPHIPLLPYAITYDTADHPWGVDAEIGVDKDKPQGPLGNIIEYGTSDTPPLPGGAPALDTEEPRFLEALADAAERLL